jgi:hypothetical protein
MRSGGCRGRVHVRQASTPGLEVVHGESHGAQTLAFAHLPTGVHEARHCIHRQGPACRRHTCRCRRAVRRHRRSRTVVQLLPVQTCPDSTTQLESQPSPLIVLLSSQASAVVRTSSPQMDRLDERDRFDGCEDAYALAPTTSTTCAAKLGRDICGRTRRWTCIEVEGWRRAKNAAAPVV